MSLLPVLERGLEAMGLKVAHAAKQSLLDYIALLLKWNRVYNLTAIREPDAVLALHVLDSLSVLNFLPAGRLADVGSGGGLPGIPIAICQPERQVILLESNQKKSAFQRQAKAALGLVNVTVVHERAERYWPAECSDVVISRAFASVADFIAVAGHLCTPGGCLAAMKGQFPEDELAALPPAFHVEQSIPLSVPGVEGERHLILIRRGKGPS